MNRTLLFLFLAVSLVAGCLVAPVPLVESSLRSMWVGSDGAHGKVSIVEEQRTWYFPVLASPEGPTKMRRQKSMCRYFFGLDVSTEGHERWQHRGDLLWLTIEEDTAFYTWHKVVRLEGTKYWAAFRYATHDAQSPRCGTFEVAVFDWEKLRSKKVITARNWPAIQQPDSEYLADLRYDRYMQSISYESPEGLKRYRLLDGIEEKTNQTPEPPRG